MEGRIDRLDFIRSYGPGLSDGKADHCQAPVLQVYAMSGGGIIHLSVRPLPGLWAYRATGSIHMME